MPSNAKIQADIALCIGLADVNTMSDTRIPSLAESIVPAVVGDTNLFCESCCIINPAIAILAPAMIMLTNLGILTLKEYLFLQIGHVKMSVIFMLEAPINSDAIDKTIRAIIRYLSFILIQTFSIVCITILI